MALTALQVQKIKAIGLDRFLDQHKNDYKKMATDAYEFTARALQASHERPRQDDVAGHLQGFIELDQPLQAFLQGKKQTQQYWAKYFTSWILDRLWTELENEHPAQPTQAPGQRRVRRG